MARNNDNKMLRAVLHDEDLMKFGEYTPDISTIEQALDSDNYAEIKKFLKKNYLQFAGG